MVSGRTAEGLVGDGGGEAAVDGAGVAADVAADAHDGVEFACLLVVHADHVLDHALGFHHVELHRVQYQFGETVRGNHGGGAHALHRLRARGMCHRTMRMCVVRLSMHRAPGASTG